jgi:5-methylcytosine-specific restriction endonuclease McrA
MVASNRVVICAGCSLRYKINETSLYRKKRFCGNQLCKTSIDIKVKNSNYKKQQRKIEKGTFRPGVEKELRAKILERDGHVCRICFVGSETKKMQVHHIVPLSDGGDDTISNLIVLCSRCHTDVHKEGYQYYVSTFKSYTKKMEKTGC